MVGLTKPIPQQIQQEDHTEEDQDESGESCDYHVISLNAFVYNIIIMLKSV